MAELRVDVTLCGTISDIERSRITKGGGTGPVCITAVCDIRIISDTERSRKTKGDGPIIATGGETIVAVGGEKTVAVERRDRKFEPLSSWVRQKIIKKSLNPT